MPSIKEDAIKLIRLLPEDVTLDDVIGDLYFKLQVDSGIAELDRGEGIPHAQVEKRLAKWLDEY